MAEMQDLSRCFRKASGSGVDASVCSPGEGGGYSQAMPLSPLRKGT